MSAFFRYTFISFVLLICTCQVRLRAQGAVGNSMTFMIPFPYAGPTNKMNVFVCAGARAATITVTIYIDQDVTTQVYQVAANSTLKLPVMPYNLMIRPTSGSSDVTYRKSVRIHSDMPVTVYADYLESSACGSTPVIPVRSWGYDYQTMGVPFDKSAFLCVVAAYNNTKLEITPSMPTNYGRAAGVPYTITLHKGEAYQIYVDNTSAPAGEREFTGSRVRSVPNSFGISYPVGVFIGSIGTALVSGPEVFINGCAEYEIEQMPAVCNWGKSFLTMPFVISSSVDASFTDTAMFRVMVQNPATIVKLNGTQLTGLINNQYYEFISGDPDYIEADMPVMVTQNMFALDNPRYKSPDSRDGEAMVISPLEEAGKRSDYFAIKRQFEPDYHFLSLCIPTAGLSSLSINGSNTFTRTYPHPNRPGYSVVVQRWNPEEGHRTVRSDVPFTGIAYSLPVRTQVADSRGYNISRAFYPEGDAMITMKDGGGQMKNIACLRDSFRLVLKTEYLPEKIEWFLKNYPGLIPNHQNVVVQNPVPDSTVARDGHTYHYFSLPEYYKITTLEDYAIPVNVTSTLVRNCSQVQTYVAEIYTGKKPVPDFNFSSKGCVPFNVKFTAGAVGDTSVITNRSWDFDGDKASAVVVNHTYETQGEKSVYLKLTGRNTCTADTIKKIVLTDAIRPVAAFQLPAAACTPKAPAKFINQSAYTGTEPGGLTWQWDLGDGAKAVSKDTAYDYKTAKSYIVQLIATASDGCSDTVKQTLSVYNRPEAGFSVSDTRLCLSDTLRLTDESVLSTGLIQQWIWELGDGYTSALRDPKLKYIRPGVKSLSHFVISQQGCYSDTVKNSVEIFDIPKVEAGPDQVILQGAAVQLKGSVQVQGTPVLRWAPAQTLSNPSVAMPMARPVTDQLYYLTAVTGNKCSAYDSVLVKVLPDLLPPNAFSPNGDGLHDKWEIPGLDSYPAALVQVFNRYGQKVYESKGYKTAWDGFMNQQQLPAGTYYYMIRPGEGRGIQSGSVSILR